MVDVTNNSFIPKRGPIKKARRVVTRQVYVFTLVSYILIFASLIASLGVFIYEQVINRQLSAEVVALDSEIASFNQADMERVTAFNNRLQQAKARLNATVSIASLLDIVEKSTITTAQFMSFSLERELDDQLVVITQIETDSFDSVIFQREILKQNQAISNVEVTDLAMKDITTTQAAPVQGTSKISSPQSLISFNTILTIDLETVGYNPTPSASIGSNISNIPPQSSVEDTSVTTLSAQEVDTEIDNLNGI